MTLGARLSSWLQATLGRSRMEREMDAELRLHMANHAEYLIEAGIHPQEARRRAQLEFGGIEQIKDACRDARGAAVLESLFRDVRFGLRMLRRNPGFTLLAVMTVALGIGSTTAVFSIVNAALLRELPYRDPQKLVFLYEPDPVLPGVPLEAWGPFNADFYELKKESRSFSGLALFHPGEVNLGIFSGANRPSSGMAFRVNASRVTGEFFRVLGIAPALGRAIGADDDRPGHEYVTVIGHNFWQSQFGGDLNVLGKQLLLDREHYRVIGVMPTGFAFPHGNENPDTIGKETDLWIPWAMSPAQRAARDDNPGNAIGRLREGSPPQQAQAELSAIAARLDPLRPQWMRGASKGVVRPLDITVTGASRGVLLIFLGAVLLVLLIACTNVSSLILVRANARTFEVGVRTAFGAPRLRLIRQLVTESFILAGAGALPGISAAIVSIRLLIRFHPVNIPRLDEASIDWRVSLFTICAVLATVLAAGLFPALSIARCNLNEMLKSSGGRSVKGRAGGARRGLTIAEIALTFVLLAGAGLLIRSYVKLQSVDTGFVPASTVTMQIQLDDRYSQPERQQAFFRDVLTKTGNMPGVEAAGMINMQPLSGGESISLLEVEGHAFDGKVAFESRSITPHYFAAMGVSLLDGRDFTDADVAGRPPVAIVSRGFARKYFPGQSALGKRIRSQDTASPWWTIVGVVNDIRYMGLEKEPPMQFYAPLWQIGVKSVHFAARTSLPPEQMAAAVRAAMVKIDPAIAVADVRTMSEVVSEATAERRFQTLLLTGFAGASLFLSLLGLYALMAYSVEQRTAELGIRIALGAQRGGVLQMVLMQGAKLVLAGVAAGIVCALGLTRLMSSLLFEVKPTDGPTFFGVAILFCVVALAACYVPARRATRVDPVVALRYE